jgi:hypothetical protein
MIQNILLRIGRAFLNTNKINKQRVIPDYNDMKRIGILYNADSNEHEMLVQQFANELRESGKKVLLMGFVNQKDLPHQKKPHISNEYFWKAHLNFIGLPITEKIGKFCNEPFDLLINMYFNDELPLQAMSLRSKALFKIGYNSALALPVNNMLIDTGNNKNPLTVGRQMIHYLQAIKSN